MQKQLHKKQRRCGSYSYLPKTSLELFTLKIFRAHQKLAVEREATDAFAVCETFKFQRQDLKLRSVSPTNSFLSDFFLGASSVPSLLELFSQ